MLIIHLIDSRWGEEVCSKTHGLIFSKVFEFLPKIFAQ